MECKRMVALVGRLMDGELTEEEQLVISLHLDTCPACSNLYRDGLRLKALTAGAIRVTAPRDFSASVLIRIERERVDPFSRYWRRLDASLARLNRVEIGSLAIALSLVFGLVVMPASKLTVLVDFSNAARQKIGSLTPSVRQAQLFGISWIGGDDERVGK